MKSTFPRQPAEQRDEFLLAVAITAFLIGTSFGLFLMVLLQRFGA